jgi:hypothetical protein
MEQNTITNVWLEVQYDGDSFNLTLLSEAVGRQAKAEAVTNLDPEAVADGSVFSLSLSDETRTALVENQQSDNPLDQLETAPRPTPERGQVMVDDNPAPWSNDTRVVVEEVTDEVAKDYKIDTIETVATANPSYPDDDTVILGHYKGSTKTYGFPESRLVYPDCDTPDFNDL